MIITSTNATSATRSRSGISLVEVLIGTGLLGIVLLATCGAIGSLFSMLQYSRENLRATQILIEKMEICRLYTWEQITDPKFFPKKFTEYLDPTGATNNSGNTEFSGTMSVRKGPGGTDYNDDMKTVIIEINWGKGKGRHSFQREFITYVTRNGLQSYLF